MTKKYSASISDTDILIHLAKAESLHILDYLFEKIYIPKYVYDKELRRKAKDLFPKLEAIINDENSIFTLVDKDKDFDIINKQLAKAIINEYRDIIGPGESECAGYASVLETKFIISNNTTEFKYLENNYIMLCYYELLTLCIYFKTMDYDEAKEIYNRVNNNLSRPSSIEFDRRYRNSLDRFKNNNWNKDLGM